MKTEDLEAMAARGEEDGHDQKWYFAMTTDRRQVDRMLRAADKARAALELEETRRFGPKPKQKH